MVIFLSYAAEQTAIAEEITHALRAEAHTVFFAESDLPAGQSYNQRIREAVAEADVFVFLLSNESLEHGNYTLTELSYAKRKWSRPSKAVLPILIGDLDFSKVDAYLRSVTILRPKGNVAAETAGTLAAWNHAPKQQPLEIAETEPARMSKGSPKDKTGHIVLISVSIVFAYTLLSPSGREQGIAPADLIALIPIVVLWWDRRRETPPRNNGTSAGHRRHFLRESLDRGVFGGLAGGVIAGLIIGILYVASVVREAGYYDHCPFEFCSWGDGGLVHAAKILLFSALFVGVIQGPFLQVAADYAMRHVDKSELPFWKCFQGSLVGAFAGGLLAGALGGLFFLQTALPEVDATLMIVGVIGGSMVLAVSIISYQQGARPVELIRPGIVVLAVSAGVAGVALAFPLQDWVRSVVLTMSQWSRTAAVVVGGLAVAAVESTIMASQYSLTRYLHKQWYDLSSRQTVRRLD